MQSAVPASPSLKSLLTLAWPIVVSRSSQTVIGMCDAIFAAYLGDSALAATTTGAFNTMCVLIFPFGIVFIVSSFASQLFGEGKLRDAKRYGLYGLVVAFATQLLAFAALPFVDPMLRLLPYTEEVRVLLTGYMHIRLWSLGAAIGVEALSNYYGGLGNTRLPMVANIVAMALNVALCFAFVFGRFGAPAMGVNGAALAAVIATFAGFFVILVPFLRSLRGDFAFSSAELWRMLRFGLPSGFNWFGELFAFNFYINVVVAGLGTAALAAMMSVFQLNSVSFMPAFALASAGSILVGQAIGTGNKDAVPSIVRLTLRTVATWQGVVGLAYVLLPEQLLGLFANGAPGTDFRAIGVRILMVSSAWQVFDATCMTYAEALRAAGDTAFAMWARLILAWLVFIPIAYYTVRVRGMGDVIATATIVVYIVLLAGALFWRFRTGKWRAINLTGAQG